MNTTHVGAGDVHEEGRVCPEGHPVEVEAVFCPLCLARVGDGDGPVWTPNDR